MNTKGKIDFTKTDNIQFIEEVAREISKEDKDWQWEARKIKQHSLLLWWELLEGSGQEGFKIEYDEANEVFSVYDEWKTDAETDQADQEQQQATMTNTVPEGALDTDADGNVPTFDADGNQVGTATPEEIKAAEEAVTENIDGVPAVRIKGKIRRVFNGSIRIRKAPSWSNDAVRGATTFTEKIATHVMEVDGKPMYKTLDGYFISGDPKLVEYIEE